MKPTRALSLPEFVGLMALLFATLAFSIDSMLPAFPTMAAELSPDNVNKIQLVILTFMLGVGMGTLFTGVLADAFGRKIVITIGLFIFVIGAALAYFAQSLEMLLAARFIQGIGGSAPRIVPMAMMRDLYEGRRMAQISSYAMGIFMLVPAIAPSVGAVIINAVGWRYIFASFIILAIINLLWLNIRQPETLPVEKRRPLNLSKIAEALREIAANRMVVIYIIVMTLGFTQMIGLITSIQQIYSESYGRADSFPLWFALGALLAISGTVLNARWVMGVGMRKLALRSYGAQTVFSLCFFLAYWLDIIPTALAFPLWFIWTVSIFFMAGLTFGNLNALALQPLGHIAGIAASMLAAISTICSVFLAIPIGQAFQGTPLPVLFATIICSVIAFLLMRRTTEPDLES